MSESQPVKLSENGEPWESEQDAKDYIKSKGLDAKIHVIRKYQGGWAIIDVMGAVDRVTSEMVGGGNESKLAEEKYFEVIFNPTGSLHDLPYVPLIRNGMDLRVQRGVKVVLPETFLRIADDATQTKWAVDPADRSNPVKPSGKSHRYP